MWIKGGDGTSCNGWVAFVPLHFELHELVEEITEPTFHLLTTHPDLGPHPFQRPSNGCNQNFLIHLSVLTIQLSLYVPPSCPSWAQFSLHKSPMQRCIRVPPLLFRSKPEEKKEIQRNKIWLRTWKQELRLAQCASRMASAAQTTQCRTN